MKYRLRDTGEIKTKDEIIRSLTSGKVLPKVWGEAVCDDLQIDPVLETPKPQVTEFQTAYVSGAEQDTLGNWVQSWTVADKFKDIIDDEGNVVTTVQEQIEAYLESLRTSARTRLKAERDAIIDQPINNVQVASISDRENIQGYLLYKTEEPIEWVMADNTFQLLMKSDLQVIQSTYISRKKLAYEAYANACRVLEVAATQAEIDAIEVTL